MVNIFDYFFIRLRFSMAMMIMLDLDRAGAVVEGVVVPGLAV